MFVQPSKFLACSIFPTMIIIFLFLGLFFKSYKRFLPFSVIGTANPGIVSVVIKKISLYLFVIILKIIISY